MSNSAGGDSRPWRPGFLRWCRLLWDLIDADGLDLAFLIAAVIACGHIKDGNLSSRPAAGDKTAPKRLLINDRIARAIDDRRARLLEARAMALRELL